MPVHSDYDEVLKKYFFQYGNQTRYYFDPRSKRSINDAYEKALRQQNAIESSKSKRINRI